MSFCGLEDPSAIITLLEQTPSSRFATNLGNQVKDGTLWDRIGSLFTGNNGNQTSAVGVFATTVTANTFARIVNDCETGYKSVQTIDVQCDANDASKPAANNIGCIACKETAAFASASRRGVELNAKQRDRNYQLEEPNEQLVIDLQTESCAAVCNDCYIRDLQQNLSFVGFSTCLVNVKRTDQMTALLTDEVNNQIFNESDLLGSLQRIFSGQNTCVVESFVNQINNIIDEDYINQVANIVSNTQSILIRGQGYSVAGVAQNITAEVFFQAILETEAFVSLHTQSQVNAAQQVVNNNADLTKAIYNLVIPLKNTVAAGEDIYITVSIGVGVIVVLAMLGWLFSYLMKVGSGTTSNKVSYSDDSNKSFSQKSRAGIRYLDNAVSNMTVLK